MDGLDINPNTLSPCDELRDLIPAYVIGASTVDERQRVQILLAECPEISAEMRDYVRLSQAMLQTTPAVQPPVALRQKLMQAIQTPPQTQPSAVSMTPVRSRSLNPAWSLVAAACILLIVTNGYWVYRLTQTNEALTTVTQQQNDLLAVVTNPQTKRIDLINTVNSTQTTAFIMLDLSNQSVWLYSTKLAPLPADKTYQLWLIGTDRLASAGLFRVEEGQPLSEFFFAPSLSGFTAVGISVEPRAGSDKPTTDPIAIGTL